MSPQNEAPDPNRGEDHPAASSREDIHQVVDRPLEVNHDQVLHAKTLFEKLKRFGTVTERFTRPLLLYTLFKQQYKS